MSDTNQSRPKPGECFTINVNPSQCTAYLADKKNPPLLVISLDGFRADYLNRNTVDGKLAAPTIKRLANCGVWASTGMMPVYPTKTFPNHYSIVTGLYPESHGIVDNSFFDPELNVTFSLSSPRMKNPVWWKGNPLWYTARLQVIFELVILKCKLIFIRFCLEQNHSNVFLARFGHKRHSQRTEFVASL